MASTGVLGGGFFTPETSNSVFSLAIFPVLLLTPNDLSSLPKVFRAGSEGAQSVGPPGAAPRKAAEPPEAAAQEELSALGVSLLAGDGWGLTGKARPSLRYG